MVNDYLFVVPNCVNDQFFKGKKIKYSTSQAKHRLFIGNVPRSWGVEDLRKIVSEVGPGVTGVELVKDMKNTNNNRGFAFIDYYNNACAEYSKLKMMSPAFKLGENAPTVSWADPKNADSSAASQASERRCEELITQVPESTRPLLRQIEAMQETNARRAEAWAAVERTLNSRLQEAEAKAATAEERERSVNERLSQTLSRINVLEAQISCLRAEQTQLSRTLEKERQRAAESRQEYLAAKEEADTQEGRVRQLEEEIRDIRQKYKLELQEALIHREHLQQEIEKEKAARSELERTARVHSAPSSDQTPITKQTSAFENGNLSRKISSASSLGSLEESHFLQASLDLSDSISDRRIPGEVSMSPYYVKSMTPSSFEAALRQKEGELASYMSRLASLESIRDSLADELVKMTEQCEKLRGEAAVLPGLRSELDALRRRHSAALELMGERDEELEELRADIVDLKEMYREQVNLLVNKIQRMKPSMMDSD